MGGVGRGQARRALPGCAGGLPGPGLSWRAYLRQLLAQGPAPRDLMELQGPQGAHRLVLTARFPLQGALQTLPVTGREPDTQRSPQTTPPRELLTPANPKG